MMVPPEYPAVPSSVPSPSLSISTPETNRPSIHPLETESAHTETERTGVISREFDRLLQHIHELDRLRSQETREISENLQIVRDELHVLSDYVHTHLVATERVVAEQTESLPIFHREQSVGAIYDYREQSVTAIPDYRDQSVSARSDVSEPRPMPLVVPRLQRLGLVPIEISPPPSVSLPLSSTSSSTSFLSSHHSDDFSVLGADEEEIVMPAHSAGQLPEPLSPSSDPTPSLTSSSMSSPGPTLSVTSSSSSLLSSPSPPPTFPLPSTESTESSVTALPIRVISMATIRDMLAQLQEEMTALWEEQTLTNHMLDEFQQRRFASPNNTEIIERLQRIEALVGTLRSTS